MRCPHVNPLPLVPWAQGHGDAVEAIAWSADGRGLATACADLQVRVFDVHDLGNRDPRFRFIRLPHPPIGVGFGNSNSSIVCALRGEQGAPCVSICGAGHP